MKNKIIQKYGQNRLHFVCVFLCLISITAFTLSAYSYATIYPEKPTNGFIIDNTGRFNQSFMFSTLKSRSLGLAYNQRIEIYTVIIESIEAMNRYLIEDYTPDLFAEWHLGDTSMLIVVDYQNKKAHIMMGPSWDAQTVKKADDIIEQLVMPFLEKGDVLEGVKYGINGLKAICLDEEPPKRYHWWQHPFFLTRIIPALILGIISNLVFRYRHSRFWVVVPYLGTFFFLVEWAMLNGNMRTGAGNSGGCGGCHGCCGCGGCGGCGGA